MLKTNKKKLTYAWATFFALMLLTFIAGQVAPYQSTSLAGMTDEQVDSYLNLFRFKNIVSFYIFLGFSLLFTYFSYYSFTHEKKLIALSLAAANCLVAYVITVVIFFLTCAFRFAECL